MDDRRARFNARIALHVRDGWEVVHIDDQSSGQLEALLTITAIGRPRATGLGVAQQSGAFQRYCRRITANRDGAIRVTNVACPPDLTTQLEQRDRSA